MRDDEDDYALLSSWLSDPRVLEFYEGRDAQQSIDDIRRSYSRRVMALENNTPCLIELDGTPIGYIQFYPSENGAWRIDQFIGVPEQWNRGIGTRVVRLMLEYLFQSLGAAQCISSILTRVTSAPSVVTKRRGSARSASCSSHELHEGELRDCWLLEAFPPG